MRRLRKRLVDLALVRGGLIAVATLVMYVWLAPTYIVDGDNAELATLGSIGGVAHPSGYPLYLLWLRLMSWLPAQSPAHAAAIATAILGALQVLVLHAACRAWGARATAASIAVAIYAAGPVVLRISTEAEVFALNGLIVTLVLWLAAAEGPLRGTARACALGFVAGLGLANHLTCVLLAPIGILGAVRGAREAKRPRAVTAGVAFGALALGLTPYFYLMLTRETLISWTRIETLGQLVHHFLRSDYGGAAQFSPHGKDVPAITSIVVMARTIGRAWLWVPAALGLVVMARRIVGPREPESRWGWSMLAVSFIAAGPVLASRFNVAPDGIGLYIVQRFHVLPALLLAPCVATGIDEVGRVLQARSGHSWLRSRAFGGVITLTAFLTIAGLSLPHLLRVHSPAVELGLRNTLRSLPPRAVLIAHTDLTHFGMGYLQGALGERPDVTIITWPQVPSPTYRERLAHHAGVRLEPGPNGLTTVDVARQVLAIGRPLFIDPYNSNIAEALPSYPYGVLFRIVPPGEPLPSIDEVFAINRALFEKFDLGYQPPGSNDEYATTFHQLYARLWHIIARGLARAGHREKQAIAEAFANALAPRD